MEIERNQHISPSTLLAETTPASENIPVVDLSNTDEELVARAVVKASEEWGIFQVVNHGIPVELIRQLKKVGMEFFELSETEKEVVARPADSGDVEGYTTNIKGWADHLFQRIWPPSRVNHRFWPKNSPDYRKVNEEYARHIKKLSEKIMELLSEGLGSRREALKEGLGGERVEYLLKLMFYPPCPDLDGAPPHTDMNGITLIVDNEVHGLQAFKNNNWIDIKYENSGIIVIIADQIRRMSNGRYKSAEHRVTMDMDRTRLSWGVFAEPTSDHVVGPLPELITGDDKGPKLKSYVYGDYRDHKRMNLPID